MARSAAAIGALSPATAMDEEKPKAYKRKTVLNQGRRKTLLNQAKNLQSKALDGARKLTKGLSQQKHQLEGGCGDFGETIRACLLNRDIGYLFIVLSILHVAVSIGYLVLPTHACVPHYDQTTLARNVFYHTDNGILIVLLIEVLLRALFSR